MIHKEPAKLEHARRICSRSKELKVRNNIQYVEHWVLENISRGLSWTIFWGDIPIVVGGIRVEGEIGQVWAIVSDDINKYKKSVYREILVTLDKTIELSGVHWILSVSNPESKESQRLLEHLGFTNTGSLFNGEIIFTKMVL